MPLRKNETLTGWILLQHICLHFWAWLLLHSVITPKSEDKYVVKVFNPSEFHFSEVTFFQNWYFNELFRNIPLTLPCSMLNSTALPIKYELEVSTFSTFALRISQIRAKNEKSNAAISLQFSQIQEQKKISLEVRNNNKLPSSNLHKKYRIL